MSARSVSLWSVLVHLLPAFLLGGLFAAVGVVHVSSRVLVVRAGYGLMDLEAENRALIRENDRLKLELATLKNPARLEKIAREELGLAPASPRDVMTLVSSPRLGRTPVREVRPEASGNLRAELPR
jgi:cell division protein FtsL